MNLKDQRYDPITRTISHYINEKLDGLLIQFDLYGDKIKEVEYMDGLIHGFYKSYKDGKLLNCATYVNNILHGINITYKPDGLKQSECTYINDKKEGIEYSYDDSQNIEYECNWLNSTRHGKEIYYKNRIKYLEIDYVNGLKYGKEITYENNQIKEEKEWIDGKHKTIKQFQENSNTTRYITYLDDKKHGEEYVIYLNYNGTPNFKVYSCMYIDDKKHGIEQKDISPRGDYHIIHWLNGSKNGLEEKIGQQNLIIYYHCEWKNDNKYGLEWTYMHPNDSTNSPVLEYYYNENGLYRKVVKRSNNITEECEYINGIKHGREYKKLDNNIIYDCIWLNGKQNSTEYKEEKQWIQGANIHDGHHVIITTTIDYINGKKHGNYIIKYYGELYYSCEYINDLKHGKEFNKYTSCINSQPEDGYERYYQNGKLNGMCTVYSRYDESKLSECMYLDDKKHGEEILYKPFKLISNYITGILNGLQIKYYPQGNKERETNFVNGAKHGKETLYYPNNTKQSEVEYINGLKHELEIQWYENGRYKSKINYNNGKKHGKYQLWKEDGSLLQSTFYEDDNETEPPNIGREILVNVIANNISNINH